MDTLPEFDQTTIDAASRSLERMMDNQDYGDDLIGIAESDTHFPHLDIPDNDEDLTMKQEDENTAFVDALDTLITAKFSVERNPLIRDLLTNLRDYLECHNAPDALEGYMNDIAEEINPILSILDIAPITIVPDRD